MWTNVGWNKALARPRKKTEKRSSLGLAEECT